ncbi:MAG: DUF4267 domain-containing protein [Acidimicrobiales bacterium]
MDVPAPVKGFLVMRIGAGLVAIAAPSVLARLFGFRAAEARNPLAVSTATFFGVRELALAALTLGASRAEPRALRRLLLVNAATDGLDLLLVGGRAARQRNLRRGVALFGPGAALSVALHLRAAQQVEVGA